jgi:serine/threonine protein kinase
MWALGIMAYELLTDAPVFARDSSKADIQDRLSGRAPLPWEDPETQEVSLKKLRMLKRSLVKCLSRDPAERPSASDLLLAWNKLFDNISGDNTVAVRGLF